MTATPVLKLRGIIRGAMIWLWRVSADIEFSKEVFVLKFRLLM